MENLNSKYNHVTQSTRKRRIASRCNKSTGLDDNRLIATDAMDTYEDEVNHPLNISAFNEEYPRRRQAFKPSCAMKYTDSHTPRRRQQRPNMLSQESHIKTDAIPILNNNHTLDNLNPRTNESTSSLRYRRRRYVSGSRSSFAMPTFMVMNLIVALTLNILIFQLQTVVGESISMNNNNNNDQVQQQSNNLRSSESLKTISERSDTAPAVSKSNDNAQSSVSSSSSSTSQSIVASLSSAVASAAAAAAVAAAQNHLSSGDARSLSGSAMKKHQLSLQQQQQAGRSQGLNLALKIADSIPEVPYNILHNMKKIEHAAPFYDVPNKLVGPTSKKESTATGLLTKALSTASGGTGSGSGGLGGAAEQLGYIFRSPIWKRIANSYEDFTSEFRTLFRPNAATPMKGPTSQTSKLIRDVSVPALLMLLASAIPTEWRPTRTRRKSSTQVNIPSSSSLSQSMAYSSDPFSVSDSFMSTLARPTFTSSLNPMQFSATSNEISNILRGGSGLKPFDQQLFAPSSGNIGLMQAAAFPQARSITNDVNLQFQQQQPQTGAESPNGNWLNDRSQMLAVQSTNTAGQNYDQQPQPQQQVYGHPSVSQGEIQQQQQPPMTSSIRRSGDAYVAHDPTGSSIAHVSKSQLVGGVDNSVGLVSKAVDVASSSLTSDGSHLDQHGGDLAIASDTQVDVRHLNGAKLISLEDANLSTQQQQQQQQLATDLLSRRSDAADKNLIINAQPIGKQTFSRRLGLEYPLLGSGVHGYTLIGDNTNEPGEKIASKRSFIVPVAGAIARTLSSALRSSTPDSNQVHARHSSSAKDVERRQLLLNGGGIGPDGLVLSEQRDLSLLLPQAWKDVVKRTVTNVQQQATTQWKSIEGQLTNWVQDKLRAFPIPGQSSTGAAGGNSMVSAASSTPITLTSAGQGGPAPVANLIASVSSTALNMLGLGSKSQAQNSSASVTTTSSSSVQDSSASSSSSSTTSKGKPAASNVSSSAVNRAQQSVEAALSGVANMIVGTLTNSRQQQTSNPVSQSSSSSSLSSPLPVASTNTNQRNHEHANKPSDMLAASSASGSNPVTSVASQYPTVTSSTSPATTSPTATLPHPTSASSTATSSTASL